MRPRCHFGEGDIDQFLSPLLPTLSQNQQSFAIVQLWFSGSGCSGRRSGYPQLLLLNKKAVQIATSLHQFGSNQCLLPGPTGDPIGNLQALLKSGPRNQQTALVQGQSNPQSLQFDLLRAQLQLPSFGQRRGQNRSGSIEPAGVNQLGQAESILHLEPLPCFQQRALFSSQLSEWLQSGLPTTPVAIQKKAQSKLLT